MQEIILKKEELLGDVDFDEVDSSGFSDNPCARWAWSFANNHVATKCR